MDKWRKLFNNQMIYYVENSLAPTYTKIDSIFVVKIHQKGHKLYVVLSYSKDHHESHSSILNFSEVTTKSPENITIKPDNYNQPLLYSDTAQINKQNNKNYSSMITKIYENGASGCD